MNQDKGIEAIRERYRRQRGEHYREQRHMGNLLYASEEELRERLNPGRVASRFNGRAYRRMNAPDLLLPGVYDSEARACQLLWEVAQAFSADDVADAYYGRCLTCHGAGMNSKWPKVQCADGFSRGLCPDCRGGGRWSV